MDEILELRAALEAALARIAELEKRVAELLHLEEENRLLKARLAQNSGNSSKPPSSDLPKMRSRRPSEPSDRSPGGQPGHAGKAREAVPSDQANEIVDVDPETCANCGAPLDGASRIDATPFQVLELPEVQALLREYRMWKKRCPRCGGFTRGKKPAGLPKGAFGPRIQAMVAMLSGRFRLSRREVMALLKEAWGIAMSLGSTQACCEAAGRAMGPTHADLHEAVKSSDAVHADETGFGRCGADRMWLWAAASSAGEVFLLQAGRGGGQAKELLGEGFGGILHRDRWKPYEQMEKASHQICWAHLRRDIQAMVETPGETGVQGAMLKLASDQAFALWHAFRDGKRGRNELIRRMEPIQQDIHERLARIRDGGDRGITKKARATAKDLLRQWDALWTYLHREGAEPTNNEAERTIRKAVLWRKGSFGANSDNGCRFVERILTITGTARRRNVPILGWLTRAIQARLEGSPAPALQFT